MSMIKKIRIDHSINAVDSRPQVSFVLFDHFNNNLLQLDVNEQTRQRFLEAGPRQVGFLDKLLYEIRDRLLGVLHDDTPEQPKAVDAQLHEAQQGEHCGLLVIAELRAQLAELDSRAAGLHRALQMAYESNTQLHIELAQANSINARLLAKLDART